MYIFKNALKTITRAKGRTILIFILVMVIAISACVALSIQSSAEKAKDSTYDNMTVSAQIVTDRNSLMNENRGDQEAMQELMETMQESMSLEEMEEYSTVESVIGFYYDSSISLNATDTTVYEVATNQGAGGSMGGREDKMGMTLGMSSGDFTLTGYSSHDAMTSFIDGTLTISSGAMFTQGEANNECVISEEIAALNEYEVGDEITLSNPNKEDETIDFTISGIFTCESTDSYANDIYTSYETIQSVCESSEEVSEMYVDERTGAEVSTALVGRTNGTYLFENPTEFEEFESQAVALGLDDEKYTVTSMDIETFESSILPLENLSNFTMIFFIVVLAIGALILIVFNLFSVRERKYEIGVLSAIGMPKPKVALQFISEVLMVTLVAVIIGASIGAVASNPLGDMLLTSQVESLEEQSNSVNENFGGNFSGRGQGGDASMQQPQGGPETMGINAQDVDYVDTLQTSTDLMVLLQLVGIGLLLSLLASSVGIISILRYEPLKILSERA